MIVRMLKPTFPIGVVAVVLDDENQLLILEHTYYTPSWRLPGGLMERGESPMETVVREAREEANCHIQPIAIVNAANVSRTFDVAVLAVLQSQDKFVPNAEIRDYRWVKKSEIQFLPAVQREFVQAAFKFLDHT